MSASPATIDIDAKQVRVLSKNDYKLAVRQFGPISVEPYAPVVGARVHGFRFDNGTEVDQETRRFIRQALLEYGFLSFEPGSVRPDAFEGFTTLFGSARFAGNPQAPRLAEGSQSNAIDSAYKKTRTNYIWHIDQAYRPNSQKFTALYALDVPRHGGETLFSNAVVALKLFDPLFAAYLETLIVVHDGDTQGLLSLAYANSDPQEAAQVRARTPPIEVPVVRTHPETGARQLFANELYAQRILGLSRTMSDHLLGIIFDQIKLPEICAAYKWEKDALVIWDNRIVQHRGIFNYEDQRRVLHRAVID